LSASYASTGAAGADYEVDLSASLFACLLSGSADRMLPDGFAPHRVSLQHRAGPLGFDDVVVEGWDATGIEAKIFIQAKRSFSVGDNADFRTLAKAIWQHDLDDDGSWFATIAAGEIVPNLEDVVTLIESACSQPTAERFAETWAKDGTLNGPKRTFLGALKTALKDEAAHAVWRVLRRLRVVAHDYDVATSRDRRHAIDALAGLLHGNQEAAGLFGALRDLALRQGKFAGSFSRNELLAALAPSWSLLPQHSVRRDVETLEAMGRLALDSIEVHLRAPDRQIEVSLIRAEIVADAQGALASDRRVRIVGEGGSGKSAILKRLALAFRGPVLVLKDDRVQAPSWQGYATGLGIGLSASEVALEFATRGPCLLAIDGADRLLLSERRGVVEDLLRGIAACPLRDNWSVVTSARDFQTRDLAAEALSGASLETGRRLAVGGIEAGDVSALAEAIPSLAALTARSDLGNRNRILFLLKEVLSSPHARMPYTEATLAAAWATRGSAAVPPNPRRDAALAQIGDLLVCRMERQPGRADVDAEGLEALQREGAVTTDPIRDALALAHDVHEDWVLSRAFDRHRQDLPALLRRADQPLWWLRAMRILGQILLETDGGIGEWLALLSALDADRNLDPAWSRSLLIAPLYSERSPEILQALESTLLADGAALLRRMMETLIVYETRLDDRLLRAETLAEMGEIERLRMVASLRIPQWRSWSTFLAWSTPRWDSWPAPLVPLIGRVAFAWNFVTEGTRSELTRRVVKAALPLLLEIEDAQHVVDWNDRRRPFADDDMALRDWDTVEKQLRAAIARGATAAPDLVEAYVKRITAEARLGRAQSDLIEHHGQVPTRLSRAFADLAIKHFTPRRRKPRYEGALGFSSCFDSLRYQDAGISHDFSMFPAAPDRAGFSALFAADETEALRLFHRLEMRASVYLRHFWRVHDRRRARPAIVPTPWGDIPLWGDENVYRWVRGMLGSHVLGSCYLALDDWINDQADRNRPIAELSRLVLQRNGLIATCSPLICALARHRNNRDQINAAAPFLATPRLWNYDVRRYQDDQTHPRPIGWMRRDQFYEGSERVAKRYAERQFLSNDLLLPFQLTADGKARALLQEQRQTWTAADLAAYDDELVDAVNTAEHSRRIERIRSDADPANIDFEEVPEAGGFMVNIAPPKEMLPEIEQISEAQSKLQSAMRLANWVIKSREHQTISPDMTVAEAIAHAQKLEGAENPEGGDNTLFLWRRMRAGGVVGAASIAARFGSNDELDSHRSWIQSTLVAGCTSSRTREDDALLVDDAILFNDPEYYGAEGVAALVNRGRADEPLERLTMQIATHRLSEVATAVVRVLNWHSVSDIAWDALVAALDMCVRRYDRQWVKGDARRAATTNARIQRRACSRGALRRFDQPRHPVVPHPSFGWAWVRTKSWLRPFRRVRIKNGWLFDWTRAGKILGALKFDLVAGEPRKRHVMEHYLRALVRWTQAYAEDPHASSYDRHFPFEWGRDLAMTIGHFAAATGSADLWKALLVFNEPDRTAELIGHYLDAATNELVRDGRAPDDRFWSVWRPAADWIMDLASQGRRYRGTDLRDPTAAAGFVGPYMSPIPPDWPHLEAILPTVDRWFDRMVWSKQAAHALLRFSERLDNEQRERWLLPWIARMVDKHGGDPDYWGYASIGDTTAAVLAPLEGRPRATRREVRRLLAIVADAGSLGAREVVSNFATARDR
jgi:hypothetical protein